eukprot:g462.t1
MTDLTLYLGNRTYSSWSMRAWLVLEASGLAFGEAMIRLREPGFEEALAQASPGRTVPALHDGDLMLSETLAVAEYVAELAPDAGLWPADRRERALARMMATRMAVGFGPLRAECPMNISNRFDAGPPSEAVERDIADLEALWRPQLAKPRAGGPFLFGRFGVVDAFFAPVAMRAYTHRLPVAEDAAAYLSALIEAPLVQRWMDDATREAPRDPNVVGYFASALYDPGDFPILRDASLTIRA